MGQGLEERRRRMVEIEMLDFHKQNLLNFNQEVSDTNIYTSAITFKEKKITFVHSATFFSLVRLLDY